MIQKKAGGAGCARTHLRSAGSAPRLPPRGRWVMSAPTSERAVPAPISEALVPHRAFPHAAGGSCPRPPPSGLCPLPLPKRWFRAAPSPTRPVGRARTHLRTGCARAHLRAGCARTHFRSAGSAPCFPPRGRWVVPAPTSERAVPAPISEAPIPRRAFPHAAAGLCPRPPPGGPHPP